MKQNSNKQYDLTLTDKVVACIFVILSIYFLIYFFTAKPIAILKSYNSDNILEGCLYYEGIGNKNNAIYSIDGSKIESYFMYVKSFPYAKKNTNFGLKNRCYKVKYIVVDFGPFTDFPLLNRYFIYDYIGE